MCERAVALLVQLPLRRQRGAWSSESVLSCGWNVSFGQGEDLDAFCGSGFAWICGESLQAVELFGAVVPIGSTFIKDHDRPFGSVFAVPVEQILPLSGFYRGRLHPELWAELWAHSVRALREVFVCLQRSPEEDCNKRMCGGGL